MLFDRATAARALEPLPTRRLYFSEQKSYLLQFNDAQGDSLDTGDYEIPLFIEAYTLKVTVAQDGTVDYGRTIGPETPAVLSDQSVAANKPTMTAMPGETGRWRLFIPETFWAADIGHAEASVPVAVITAKIKRSGLPDATKSNTHLMVLIERHGTPVTL